MNETIKTPVKYHHDTSMTDANGRQIAFAIFAEGPEMERCINEADELRQKVERLELSDASWAAGMRKMDAFHAELKRKCERLTKALEHYARICETCGHLAADHSDSCSFTNARGWTCECNIFKNIAAEALTNSTGTGRESDAGSEK